MDTDVAQKVSTEEVFEAGAFVKYGADAEAAYTLLLLVDVAVTPQMVVDWSPEQRMLAAHWAATVYLIASDNDDIQAPEKPSFIPGPPERQWVEGTIIPKPPLPFEIAGDPSTGRQVYTLSLAERAWVDAQSSASAMYDQGDQAPVLPNEPPPQATAPEPAKPRIMCTYETPDVDGYAPNLAMLGTLWEHWKNGRVYVITGFHVNAVTEKWCYEYIEQERYGSVVPMYSRDVEDWHSYPEGHTGGPRFARVYS